ncbi:periplasmic nitrate reductase, NapE protein [Paracidovorax wautersii]|uniref:Nitrate reductase NapE n=1 Tax=Paracidovorax wautersii TaxID=1177982 RepID=A0ABU1IBU8_9BURK|nr:periplasmic nitrate reductase, NapE protein [Paracidovorax wautersii]MDR6214416.1 nitrate reductase NapE [Paracidovorax wautersii]
MSSNTPDAPPTGPSTRQEEARSFVFLAAVMVPVLAVLTVASYGFMVWFYQMFAGPPGS